MKIWSFKGIERNECSLLPISFPPLKLPNKGMKEYYKIILFISFHFIPFTPPKRCLKDLNPLKTKILNFLRIFLFLFLKFYNSIVIFKRENLSFRCLNQKYQEIFFLFLLRIKNTKRCIIIPKFDSQSGKNK